MVVPGSVEVVTIVVMAPTMVVVTGAVVVVGAAVVVAQLHSHELP